MRRWRSWILRLPRCRRRYNRSNHIAVTQNGPQMTQKKTAIRRSEGDVGSDLRTSAGNLENLRAILWLLCKKHFDPQILQISLS